MLLTTVKHALSVSLYEGIIFLSYFKEKRIKKCQRKDVEESVDKIIANRMSKAYSEWKSNQDTQSFNENIEKEYQKLLETLSPEQEKVLTKYCDEIFASGAETEEFFYRLGIKDGLRLKSTVMVILISMATAIYFGKWIKTTLPINLLFLLLFVQLVYVGIRWYVKGWRETRGYH